MLPLCDEQQYAFNINETITNIPMKISYSMKFSKNFSPEKLIFAIHKCIETADIFGARCITKDNLQFMEFLPYQKHEIPVFNFKTDKEYQSFSKKTIKENINNRDKLYYIYIYSIGDSNNHIHFTINHLIFDARSAILLSEKIQRVLLGLENEVNWYPFSAYLQKNEKYNESEKYLQDKVFWEDRFLEFSKSEYVFKEIIDMDQDIIKESNFQTSKSFKKELLEFCSKNNISLHLLIVTVLASIINSKTGSSQFYYDITVGNRLGSKEKNSLGVYELGHSYVFDFNEYNNILELYNSVYKQTTAYYKHKDFDWIRKTSSKEYEDKYGKFISQVCFSYICNNQKPEISIAILDYQKNEIDMLPMNLLISDYLDWESMTFNYIYWKSYFTEEEVIEIHKDVEKKLSDIINNEWGEDNV